MSKKKYLYRYNAFREDVDAIEICLEGAFFSRFGKPGTFILKCITPKGYRFRCERRWVKSLKVTDYLKYEVQR